MKTNWLLYLLVLVVTFACKKEEKEDFIQMGKTNKMIINSYDTLLVGGYNTASVLEIDINKDGVNDFKLKSEIWGSPGMGQHPAASIACLSENCSIKGQLVNDSTFYRSFVHSYYGENGSPFYIQYYQTYSNIRINEYDSVFSILTDVFKVNYLNYSDVIYQSDLYQSKNFVLTEGYSATIDGPYPNVTNDTVRSYFVTHYYNSNTIPDNTLSYIGVKLKSSNEEKLGWIKLGVTDSYKIILLETAIQN